MANILSLSKVPTDLLANVSDSTKMNCVDDYPIANASAQRKDLEAPKRNIVAFFFKLFIIYYYC